MKDGHSCNEYNRGCEISWNELFDFGRWTASSVDVLDYSSILLVVLNSTEYPNLQGRLVSVVVTQWELVLQRESGTPRGENVWFIRYLMLSVGVIIMNAEEITGFETMLTLIWVAFIGSESYYFPPIIFGFCDTAYPELFYITDYPCLEKLCP